MQSFCEYEKTKYERSNANPFVLALLQNEKLNLNTKQLAMRNSEKFVLRTFCTLHSFDRYSQCNLTKNIRFNMGTWGTAISSNDTYADIYSEFMSLYDDGLEPQEITIRLINKNSDLINGEESNNFWFALAKAQWECNSLDLELFQKVKVIIESGKDIKLWQDLGADKTNLNKREKVLLNFLVKLSVEKEKPRKRKRKVLRNSIFSKGDCLIFKLDNGYYGGAFVLYSEKQTEFGLNLIAITDIKKSEKPTLNDFKKAHVLFQKIQFGINNYKDRAMISWYYAQFYKKHNVNLEAIGNLKVEIRYNIHKDYTGGSSWDMIKSTVESHDKVSAELGKSKKKIKLTRYRKKHWL